MQLAPVPPLLALLAPAPVDPDAMAPVLPEALRVDVALDEPGDLPFDRLLARADDAPPEPPPETAVFVPAGVEVLVRAAQSSAPVQTEQLAPTRDPMEAVPRHPGGSPPTAPDLRLASPPPAAPIDRLEPSAATAPVDRLGRSAPPAPAPQLATTQPLRATHATGARSPLELLRSPELQAPATLDAPPTEPDLASTPSPVPVATPRLRPPTRRLARPAVPTATTATSATTEAGPAEPDAPRPIEAPVADAPVDAPRAALDVPELAAPVPQRVTVKVDDDLDIDISADGEGIGVVLEGTAEAVDPLREIAPDLSEELARAGLELTDFDARERGDDSPQGKAPAPSARTSEDETEPTPTRSNHDGLVDVIA